MTVFEYFPEAREVFERFPTRDDTIGTFVEGGFACERAESLVQQSCASLAELASRTRPRTDTTLRLMSDEAFKIRQDALEAKAREAVRTPAFDTIDFLVFRRV
jgi:hypothetical protein